MSVATAPAIISDAKIFASDETNRLKGFIGTADEMTAVATVVAPHSVESVKSLTDDELFPLGERALHDIADDILVLDEIKQRFRQRGSMRGYSGWKDFVEKNSRYSMRTIQNRLAEKNGKDDRKVNHKTGNMYTRHMGPSVMVKPPAVVEAEVVPSNTTAAVEAAVPTQVHTYPQEDYKPEQQTKAASSRSHGMGLERLRKLAAQRSIECSIGHDSEVFRITLRFESESKATHFLKSLKSL